MKESIVRRLIINCCLLCVIPVITLFFFTQIKGAMIFILFVTIPTGILTIWLVIFIRNRVIKPLNLLTEEANHIASGNLSHPIISNIDDEIGAFVKLFENMRKTLEEQELKRQLFEIERKNFVTSISHDMKTPIASIAAYVEALQDQIATTPTEEVEYLTIIERKLGLLTELSKQLSLSYMTPDELILDFQVVRCGEWASQFIADFQSECKFYEVLPKIGNIIPTTCKAKMFIDTHQFNRAVQNILGNAFRYTKDFLQVTTDIDDKIFCLKIINDGEMPLATDIDEIFERFYTESYSDSQGHLGLGLFIAKTIIHSMEGSLTAYISEGRITFEIQIPLCLKELDAPK